MPRKETPIFSLFKTAQYNQRHKKNSG